MINATTKVRGRPATGKGTPIQVRLQPEQLEALDKWIEKNHVGLTRPAAIRALLAQSLKL